MTRVPCDECRSPRTCRLLNDCHHGLLVDTDAAGSSAGFINGGTDTKTERDLAEARAAGSRAAAALPDWYCRECGHEWLATDAHDEPEHWDATCPKCGAQGMEMIYA